MYLVELRPGKEELYRSSDELAVAIRNGDVDARSRIYHRATAKWISITLHPQYKAIVAAAKEDPVARPPRRGWNLLTGASDQIPPSSAGDAATSNSHLLYRWRRPLALGLSALLLISGIQLAFSGPRPPWSGRGRVAVAGVTTPKGEKTEKTQRTESTESGTSVQRSDSVEEVRTSEPELVSLASTKTLISAMPASTPAVLPVLPRAPRLKAKSLKEALVPGAAEGVDANSLQALLARYSAAHDSARSRLETGMRVARLTGLFAAPRLSPTGGVTDTRMSLAGAANFIRVYRQQQAAIEVAYQDSVTILAKQRRWSPKQVREWYSRHPRKETPTLQLLSGSLIASIDSVLGVLDAQAGAYKIRGSAIAFEDPTAGQTYGALRRRIKEQISAAVAAGGATSSGPAGLLLQAIGTTALPRET
ncbi:MAG TPA: hypothetical protein VGJ36_04660 [Gemmatimonadales bacterium]|jgi:hypothetical protein